MFDTKQTENRTNVPVTAVDNRCARQDFLPRWILGVLMAAFLAASCLPQPAPTRPARDGLSEIQVYLQPVPPEARRITWTLSDLSAVRREDTLEPLTMRADRYRGSEQEGRQTLLASGFVPPGSYSGVSLTIKSASIRREDGDMALMVPEDPIFIKAPFDSAPSEVLPLFINLDRAGIVEGGFAFSPDFSITFPGTELASLTGYLTIPESDQITIFNRKTLRVIGALSTGSDPMAMAVDQARDRAYVSVIGDNAVEVIDIFGGDVRERITLRSADEPVDLALSGDGQVLLTANYASGTVSLIDPVQAVETDRIEVGRGPTTVTVNRSGTRAYVTCSLSGTISVIDLSTGTLSASLSIEETTPLAAALDGEEKTLFVIGQYSSNLTVIDTASLTVTNRIYVGTGSVSIAVDELSGLVFIGREPSSDIAIVDPSVLLPVDQIRLESAPGQMAVDLQEKALLVTLPGKRVLQKVDLVSRRIMAEMELDGIPQEVAVVE